MGAYTPPAGIRREQCLRAIYTVSCMTFRQDQCRFSQNPRTLPPDPFPKIPQIPIPENRDLKSLFSAPREAYIPLCESSRVVPSGTRTSHNHPFRSTLIRSSLFQVSPSRSTPLLVQSANLQTAERVHIERFSPLTYRLLRDCMLRKSVAM